MIFATLIADGMVVRTYGSDDLEYLTGMVVQGMPVGCSYRFISKGNIMRLEVLSPDVYVAIFTNLEKHRHSWVIRKVLDQIDQDNADLADDEDTELE